MSDLLEFAQLAPLGFVVGAYGTLVGAGGGFVLVPLLLIMWPDKEPATVTSIALAVVFFNAYTGTIAYARMGRIDYFAAVLFALAAAPGAVLGPMLVHELPRALFQPFFGLIMLAGGTWLAFRPLSSPATLGRTGGSRAQRTYLTSQFNTLLGSVGTSYIAMFSSMFGLGGGIFHVPFLVRVLEFPPHVATATSHFVLVTLTLIATISHVFLGAFDSGLECTMYLAVGVMMGSPIGAVLSTRVGGSLIVRLLAVGLCLVGLRLVVAALV